MKSIFPETMLSPSTGGELTLEGIASKLVYFENQLHLIHWQTSIFAEHKAMDFYDTVHGFIDDIMEKMMGYTGRKPRAFKFIPIVDNASSREVVSNLKEWCKELKSFADTNGYQDIANISDSLSGECAKILYLLTLS
jgi:hypothetical protein